MPYRLLSLVVLCLAALMPMHAQAQGEDAERLRIHGSNVLGEKLVPDMVEAWLKGIGYEQISRRAVSPQRLEIHAVRDQLPLIVEIDKRGTHAGLAALAAGDAEIAMSTRQPNAAELDQAWQLGDLTSPDQQWVLGLEGVVVLVAPGNPVSTLNQTQLRDVLSGKVRNWRDVGGAPGPIHVKALGQNTGTGELVSGLLLRGAAIASGSEVQRDYASVVAAVQTDPWAIGIVGLHSPRGALKALAIRSGGMAVAPDRVSILAEDYPLQRRVYFHTGQLITALGRGFVQFALTAEGQAMVQRSPLASLALRPLPAGASSDGPEEYRSLVAGATRLPTNIRFGHSAYDLLDSRGRQDLARIGSYLRLPGNAHRRVLLVGFANPEPKAPYQSLSRSQECVDFLASELLALNLRVVKVRGFGGSRNLMDASTPGARSRNERVEVWMR